MGCGVRLKVALSVGSGNKRLCRWIGGGFAGGAQCRVPGSLWWAQSVGLCVYKSRVAGGKMLGRDSLGGV